MGKCSGLKGGGHHRRALDVAQAKQAAKANQKQEQVQVGKRAAACRELLTLDPHCDLFLDAAICNRHDGGDADPSATKSQQGSNNSNKNKNKNKNKNRRGSKKAAAKLQQAMDERNEVPNKHCASFELPELCRRHFRHASCKKKRCKLSHEHCIADALDNVTRNANADHGAEDDGPVAIPCLSFLPGSRDGTPSKKKMTVDRPADSERRLSPIEGALLEGSLAIDLVASCLEADVDVVRFGMASRSLCRGLLVGLGGAGCPDVQRRRQLAARRQMLRRNDMVTGTKNLAGSLRYAVSHVPAQGGTANSARRLRPVLVFDYECPYVYESFRSSGLAELLHKGCAIRE